MPEPTNAPNEVPLSEQPTVDLPPDPNPHWWRWVIDRNPMFLISGVLILAGCFMVSRHIHAIDPDAVAEGLVVKMLIGLLLVLNLYELLVIALGLLLAKTRTLVRDARHLLGLALLLLADAAFVYTETAMLDLHAGIAVVSIAALLAWFKAWLIARSLRLDASPAAVVVTMVALAAMYALPVATRAMADEGYLLPAHAMLIWGGLGVVLALYALPLRWVRLGVAYSADHRQLQRLAAGGLIVLPLISLIGHAAAALWVHESAFEPAMLAPLLLGLAAVLLRHHRALGGARPTAQAATLIAASAVVAGLLPGEGLTVESPDYTWLAFSPLRGVLIIVPVLLLWGWWISGKRLRGLVNALLPAGATALGHTPSAMLLHAQWINDSTTMLAWGLIAIGLAFASLVLGGVLSWRRRTIEQRRADISELLAEPV